LNIILTAAAFVIAVNSLLCFYRTLKGPTVQDRLLGINIIGTKSITLLVLISFILKSDLYLDVAFVYALLNFVVVVAISRYLETRGKES
jgi:multicomponent Na+:H+ antiporter subunit F